MPNATNTQPLVTLPRNVADAIERLKSDGSDNFGIMQKASGNYYGHDVDAGIIWGYVKVARSERLTIIMRALIDGYAVESTPEEKVREKFRSHKKIASFYGGKSLDISEVKQERYSSGYVRGVRDFADIYGITIEGVNAPESDGYNFDDEPCDAPRF